MQQKEIKPTDIKFTSSGCIIFSIKELTDDQHSVLTECVNNIFKSYDVVNGHTQTTTEDGFLEIYFSLNPYKIERDEFSKKLSEVINSLNY